MATIQARIRSADGRESMLPVEVPDLAAVRQLASRLHSAAVPWQATAFGWLAEYVPQSDVPPPQSHMRFTPAEFCIGESGIWFFSLMWEQGAESPPTEFLDESGLVR